MEIWKDVVGYEELYKVSNLGRIKSLGFRINNPINYGKEKILKPNTCKLGYMYVGLTKNRILKSLKIHRLVAMAFMPNPENKPQVNHINGIKSDNCIGNLEWNTAKENMMHAVRTGLKKGVIGCRNGFSKLTEDQVIEIRSIKNVSQYEIAKQYNVGQATINRLVRRISWNHI